MRSDVNGKRRRRRTNEPKVNARMDGCRGEKKEKCTLYRLSKEKLTGEDMAAADPDEFTIAN
jgi:hypothetical protein